MAVTFVLDTSAYSSFVRGDVRLQAWFLDTHTILMPLIVIGELRAGFAAGSKQAENDTQLQRFLDAPNVLIHGIDDAQTHVYARLYAALRAAGTPMGTNDMWIAALALQHDVKLLTVDADFTRVSGLRLAEI